MICFSVQTDHQLYKQLKKKNSTKKVHTFVDFICCFTNFQREVRSLCLNANICE